jgi:hypothetical protein
MKTLCVLKNCYGEPLACADTEAALEELMLSYFEEDWINSCYEDMNDKLYANFSVKEIVKANYNQSLQYFLEMSIVEIPYFTEDKE